MKRAVTWNYIRVHTAAALFLGVAYAVAAFTVSGALPSGLILFSEAAVAFVSGDGPRSLGRWAHSLHTVLPVVLTVFVINALLGPGYSEMVVWRLPFFTLTIMAEAVTYGVAMALRLLAAVGAFSLLWMMADEDELLFLLSSPLSKSSLAVALTLRLAPYIARRVTAVRDAQAGRGAIRPGDGVVRRLKAAAPVLKAAVYESLELSVNLAEAMFARGWGAGPRSRYPSPRPGLNDLAVCAASVVALALFTVAGKGAGPATVLAAALPPAACAVSRVVVGCLR
ncbi:MAG: hypothetical protein HPY55_03315 [Firmicutes bacterium]|nr:hypothetical protein [Bacillota bacterium]